MCSYFDVDSADIAGVSGANIPEPTTPSKQITSKSEAKCMTEQMGAAFVISEKGIKEACPFDPRKCFIAGDDGHMIIIKLEIYILQMNKLKIKSF